MLTEALGSARGQNLGGFLVLHHCHPSGSGVGAGQWGLVGTALGRRLAKQCLLWRGCLLVLAGRERRVRAIGKRRLTRGFFLFLFFSSFFPDPYVKFGALAFWGDEFFIEACAMLRIHFSFPIYPRFILTQPGVTYTRKLGFSR